MLTLLVGEFVRSNKIPWVFPATAGPTANSEAVSLAGSPIITPATVRFPLRIAEMSAPIRSSPKIASSWPIFRSTSMTNLISSPGSKLLNVSVSDFLSALTTLLTSPGVPIVATTVNGFPAAPSSNTRPMAARSTTKVCNCSLRVELLFKRNGWTYMSPSARNNKPAPCEKFPILLLTIASPSRGALVALTRRNSLFGELISKLFSIRKLSAVP